MGGQDSCARCSLVINALLLAAGLYMVMTPLGPRHMVSAPIQITRSASFSPVMNRMSGACRRDLAVDAKRRRVDVLLKEEVDGTGKKGDIVAVKPGFYRNFLMPQGIAVQPSAEYLEQLRLEDERKIAEAKAKKDAALKLRDGLQILSFTIRVKAKDDGTLYGSIRPQDIVEAVKSQTGAELDAKTIELPPEMSKLATYTVYANLHPEVKAAFPVSIQRGK